MLRYQPLGATGLEVSAIGFGASPLGGVYGSMAPGQAQAAVQRAIDVGINFFDVAPYYGLTLAEERLGLCLLGRRADVVLATKCGRYGAEHFDFSASYVTREFERSLRRLKTDYVDLLQVHDVEFGTMRQIVEETLPVLRRLQQQGKVRFLGITGYWPDLLAEIASAAEVDTVLNYCHFNLLMNDMDDELTPAALGMGLGLLNASPLHMGLLGGAAPPAWHPAPIEVRRVAQQVASLCREHGFDPAAVALNACLTHAAVASTFIGLNSATEVDQAVQALDLQVPHELRHEIDRLVEPIRNTTWPSGRPEHQQHAKAKQVLL